MITINNKEYRNLQEQVLKNKEDIARHYDVDRVLADWGIKVLGVVSSIDSIPEAEYNYGDAFGLSTTEPMQYVIWTRANNNVGEPNDYWLNIGAISLVGPQGPRGPQGIQGIQGERGSIWYSSSTTPTPSDVYNTGDEWLDTSTGNVYRYFARNDGSNLTGSWSLTGNIKGPQGPTGPTGPKGEQGIQGPVGPQGPKGDTGSSFQIGGLLDNADLLPVPTESNRHIGYAIKNADGVTYDLYIVVGTDTLLWVNMGRVEGVEGPQGPIGPQGIAGVSMQNITYAELLNKVNTSGLKAGELYRITDYITTTTQENTRSAGHQFDIIVIANSVNTLNENAYAIQHEGDIYFANSKLNAWQLKYDINNNKNKYYWADTTNGKGVIWYMKDEFNNECFYDFKNIQFTRKLTDGILDLDNGLDTWCYTFNCYQNRNNVYSIIDCSMPFLQLSEEEKQAIIDYDEDLYSGAFNNKIDYWFDIYHDYRKLNDIVFLNLLILIIEEGNISDLEDFVCHSNTFGNECHSNTFGTYCHSNTFGTNCSSNTFGNYCSYNTFGNVFYSNTFGNNCRCNTFGYGCRSNTFGHYIQYIECSPSNRYISLNVSDTESSINPVQYVKLDVGLIGKNSNRIEINATRNLSHWVIYKSANTTEIEI